MSALRNKILRCPYRLEIYSKISPRLCDVTLRDGLQNADSKLYPTEKKQELFSRIMALYNPHSIEIGSLISPKILPILRDSIHMYNYATQFKEESRMHRNNNIFMLVPSASKLITALNLNISHMSFITSVSDAFQMKNTHKTIEQTKEEFQLIKTILGNHNEKRDVDMATYNKLYISCVTECPIEGKIHLDFIIKEIQEYYSYGIFDELCISDTCGNMSFDEFKYIVDKLTEEGISPKKLSLHLHVTDFNTTKHILWYAFSRNIEKFDVSELTTGGCSVTMNPDELKSNLTYKQFYTILDKYIEKFLW